MKVVIAPDSFKGTITAADAASAIAAGVRSAWPSADVVLCPMADGGEGTADTLLVACGGESRSATVRGPLGENVTAQYALIDDGRTAVVDMAAAAGMTLVPPSKRNPLNTTTFGVGQLILHAIIAGAQNIIVGLGGSATVDGGIGAAQAVGVQFDCNPPLETGDILTGGDLSRIQSVSLTHRDPRIKSCDIVAAYDVENPLIGPSGAAEIYGPQKGASPEDVSLLDSGLHHLAKIVEFHFGISIAEEIGSGAAGGLGVGLVAFFGATLTSGIELVMEQTALDQHVADADLVITGEGRFDAQSAMGKVIAGVSRTARRHGAAIVAIVGSAADDPGPAGALVDACFDLSRIAGDAQAALDQPQQWLTEAAARELPRWWTARTRDDRT